MPQGPDVTSVHFDESELSDYQRTLLAGLLFGRAEEQVVLESGRRGGRTFMGSILEEIERQQRADLNAAIDAAMPHRRSQAEQMLTAHPLVNMTCTTRPGRADKSLAQEIPFRIPSQREIDAAYPQIADLSSIIDDLLLRARSTGRQK